MTQKIESKVSVNADGKQMRVDTEQALNPSFLV